MGLFEYHVTPIAETYAYCLLRNHFHLFLRVKTKAEISDSSTNGGATNRFPMTSPGQHLGNLLNAYAKSINHAYHRTGSLFQHPFGRILVWNKEYIDHLIRYIHQNPQHHGFVKDFRDWPFSSFHCQHEKKIIDATGMIYVTKPPKNPKPLSARRKTVDLGLLRPLIANDFF
jgi:putative transposase